MLDKSDARQCGVVGCVAFSLSGVVTCCAAMCDTNVICNSPSFGSCRFTAPHQFPICIALFASVSNSANASRAGRESESKLPCWGRIVNSCRHPSRTSAPTIRLPWRITITRVTRRQLNCSCRVPRQSKPMFDASSSPAFMAARIRADGNGMTR
jgi:hypothetical protein